MSNGFTKLTDALTDRSKPNQTLTSAGQLTKWVVVARKEVNETGEVSIDEARLGWLVASAVVVGALQRARNEDSDAIFLLKGGSYLQYRLGLEARATKDIDGLVRGDIESFLANLDLVLREPWGNLDLTRTEIEIINAPGKVIKPRRFYVKLQVRGVTWRSIQVEVSPDEGGISQESDALPAPPLHGFGLPTPDELFGIAIRNQIAQKLHAVTDPHNPPDFVNDRARDLVDLVLLRKTVMAEGLLSPGDIRDACLRVFKARAEEAEALNRPQRTWPPTASSYPNWANDYKHAADQSRLGLSLEEAVAAVNDWIGEIDSVL